MEKILTIEELKKRLSAAEDISSKQFRIYQQKKEEAEKPWWDALMEENKARRELERAQMREQILKESAHEPKSN